MLLVNKFSKSIFWAMVLFFGSARNVNAVEIEGLERLSLFANKDEAFPLPERLIDVQIEKELMKLKEPRMDLEEWLKTLTEQEFQEILIGTVKCVVRVDIKVPVLKGYLSLQDWIAIFGALPESWRISNHWNPMRAALIESLESLKDQFEDLPPVEVDGLELYNPRSGQDLNLFLPSYSENVEIISRNNYLKKYGSSILKTRALCWQFGPKNHDIQEIKKHLRELKIVPTSRQWVKIHDFKQICLVCSKFSQVCSAIRNALFKCVEKTNDTEFKPNEFEISINKMIPTEEQIKDACLDGRVLFEPIFDSLPFTNLKVVEAERDRRIEQEKKFHARENLGGDETSSRRGLEQSFNNELESLKQGFNREIETVKLKQADLEKQLQQRKAEREARRLAAQEAQAQEEAAQLERDRKRAEAIRLQEELSPVLEKTGQVAARYERLRKEDQLNEKEAKREALLKNIEICKDRILSLGNDLQNYSTEGYKFENFDKKPDENYIVGKIANEQKMLKDLVRELKLQEAPDKPVVVLAEPVAIPEPVPAAAPTVDQQPQADQEVAQADLRARIAQERTEREKIIADVAAKVDEFKVLVKTLRDSIKLGGISSLEIIIKQAFECVEFYNTVIVKLEFSEEATKGDVARYFANLQAELLKAKDHYLLDFNIYNIFAGILGKQAYDLDKLKTAVKDQVELGLLKTEMEAANKALQDATDRKATLAAGNTAKITSLEGQVAELKVKIEAKEGEMAGILKAQPKVKARVAGRAISGTKSPAYQNANRELTGLKDNLQALGLEKTNLLAGSDVRALGEQISKLESEFEEAKKQYEKAHNNSFFAEFALEKIPMSLPAEPLPSPRPGRSKPRGRSRSKDRSLSPGQDTPGPVSEPSASPAEVLTGTRPVVPEPTPEEIAAAKRLQAAMDFAAGTQGVLSQLPWNRGGASAAPAQPPRRAQRVPPPPSKPVGVRPERVGGGFAKKFSVSVTQPRPRRAPQSLSQPVATPSALSAQA